MEKTILIAIDGSVYSNQSLTYAAAVFRDQPEINVTLMTCIVSSGGVIPEPADRRHSLLPTNPALDKKISVAKRSLKKAEEKLVRLGFDPDRVSSSSHVSGINIAATIQHEVERLLVDAVLVGRRGLDRMSEALLGSVSSGLFKKCHSTPLWIIDGEVKSKNFLVPVDGSLPSLLAIDHLGHILADRTDIKIFLYHCSRFMGKKVTCDAQQFYDRWEKKWCDDHLSGKGCLFNGPRILLADSGIPEENIIVLPESMDLEESHGILRQAKKYDCGTVILGRRGVGMAKGLFGGVSDRMVKSTQDMALWVVG
ncbi:MAG: universal stress protein [Thermodesulfobacteriota bacterium]